MACKYYKVAYAFSFVNFTLFLQSNLVSIGESDSLSLGKRIERLAFVGSGLTCCAIGALNDFTPKGSIIEGLLLWIALSIGVQGFPLRGVKGGRVLTFFWVDAFYGFMLYILGKVPLAAIKTIFPSLAITHGLRLF